MARRATQRLTGIVAAILLVLLAAEGATILRINGLITAHVFIGMLLVPPVALKVGSVGYRMLRYYAGSLDYRLKGPPALVLRVLVAPVVLLSTAALFATGIALVVIGPGGGIVVGLHKASFIVWFIAMGVHVLWHVRGLPPLLGAEASRPTPVERPLAPTRARRRRSRRRRRPRGGDAASGPLLGAVDDHVPGRRLAARSRPLPGLADGPLGDE